MRKKQQVINDNSALAYSYLRFSSPEQAKGDSIRRQAEMRDEWCRRHGVRLDTSLRMSDEGVSAFTGEHRTNADRHALAAFLELVRQGRVAKGSFLVIENLDRLTREDAVPALNLFTGILSAGVNIVQLDPEGIYTSKSEYMEVMYAIMELSRGNSESRSKSRRMAAAWEIKRRKAAASGAVMSRRCPAWIRVEGEGPRARYVLIPERGEVVRRIFRMATEGKGSRLIVNALKGGGVPPFVRKPWNVSYVKAVLRNRSAMGEYTPRKGRGNPGGRTPVAPPIEGYYPAAVTPAEFYAAQQALDSRRGKGGRPSKRFVSVFGALIHDARTGGRMHVKMCSRTSGITYNYSPYEGIDGRSTIVSFPADALEDAVFSKLQEIRPGELLPAKDAGAGRVLVAAGRLAATEGRIAAIKAKLVGDGEGDVGALVDVLRQLEGRRQAEAQELADAQRDEASPLSAAWGEGQSLLADLKTSPDPAAARARLRAAICRMVESVWCLFMPGRGPRLAAVQVWFAGGAQRSYLILHTPMSGRPPDVRSFKDAAPAAGKLDLRRRDHAERLERVLQRLDVARLTSA